MSSRSFDALNRGVQPSAVVQLTSAPLARATTTSCRFPDSTPDNSRSFHSSDGASRSSNGGVPLWAERLPTRPRIRSRRNPIDNAPICSRLAAGMLLRRGRRAGVGPRTGYSSTDAPASIGTSVRRAGARGLLPTLRSSIVVRQQPEAVPSAASRFDQTAVSWTERTSRA